MIVTLIAAGGQELSCTVAAPLPDVVWFEEGAGGSTLIAYRIADDAGAVIAEGPLHPRIVTGPGVTPGLRLGVGWREPPLLSCGHDPDETEADRAFERNRQEHNRWMRDGGST